ncbi:MAG: hypothetical protein RL611_536 [Actinomycetota bacterium]
MKYPGDLFSDVELLKSLADLSDEISFDRFHAQDLQIETKPDATPVTDADRAVEKKIRELLLNERPLDKIVGEEFGSPDEIKSGERYWVIDPIDGTKNFLRGVPIWATLIGLVYRDENGRDHVIAGMVSSPALFRRWYAALGFGAFTEVNGGPATQISVSNVKHLNDASLSFSDLVGWGESHMLVAEGAVDIAAEPSLALWDMAAVAIVVKEAGGRFSDLENNDGPFGKSGVSTNGHLHEIFIKAINS